MKRLSLTTMLLVFYLTPALGMHPKKKMAPVLCENPHQLPAPENFKNFINEANVATCYKHVVHIAAQNPQEAEEKICGTIQGFSKYLCSKIYLGFLGGLVGRGFGYCCKGFALEGLKNSEENVGKTFLAAEQKTESLNKPEMENEKNELEATTIAKELAKIEKPEKTLPGQVASLCATRVISCMGKNKEQLVKEILRVSQEDKKGPPAFVKKIMELSIPPFVDHCVQGKKEWMLFFYTLAQKQTPGKNQ